MFAQVVEATRRAGVPVTATWIGEGDQQARQLLSAARVTVTGWVDREAVAHVMRQHDVYLHCAAWEGFPVTLLEAFAAGCTPVIRQTPSQGRHSFPLAFTTVEGAVALLKDLAGPDSTTSGCGWSSYLRDHTEDGQRQALLTSYGLSR